MMRTILIFLLFLMGLYAIFIVPPVIWGAFNNKLENMLVNCDVDFLDKSLEKNLIYLSVRDTKTKKISTLSNDWITSHEKEISQLVSKTDEVIVYIHGLNTTRNSAGCAANLFRLEFEKVQSETRTGVIVFDWPSGFGANFGRAQDMAETIAPYLSKVLEKIPSERTYVIAHSLGVHVALAASLDLVGGLREGILLVQGAVPAASLMHYDKVRKTHTPTNGFEPIALRRCDNPEARVEEIKGVSRFAKSINNYKRLVITQTDSDLVLRKIFTTDELLFGADYGIPDLPPDLAKTPRDHLSVQPLGSRWNLPMTLHFDSDLAYIIEEMIDTQNMPDEEFKLRQERKTLDIAFCVSIQFRLVHANKKLVVTNQHRRIWEPIVWHSPHLHDGVRSAIVSAIKND